MQRDPEVVLCYAKSTVIDDDDSHVEDYEGNLHLTESTASHINNTGAGNPMKLKTMVKWLAMSTGLR